METRPLRCSPLAILLLASSAFGQEPLYEREIDTVPLERAAVGVADPWTGGILAPRPLLADLDDDGDLDLLLVQVGQGLTFYRNVGTPPSYEFRFEADDWQGVVTGEWATLGDLDADGDLDLLTDGPAFDVYYHENQGSAQSPLWVLVDKQYRELQNRGIGNAPILVDVDADGDLDYLEMDQSLGTARLYRNTGTPQVSAFVEEAGSYGCIDTFDPTAKRHGISILSAGDVDADGDLDILIGDQLNPNLWFFRDDSRPDGCFTRVTPDYLDINTAGLNTPALGDLDGDLDLDLLVGVGDPNTGLDNFLLAANIGTPSAPDHQVVSTNLIVTFDLGLDSHPAAGDLDDDGDVDLFVGSDQGTVVLLDNVGTPRNPSFSQGDPLVDETKQILDVGFAAAPELVDYDGDEDLDLFVGAGDGKVWFYRNVGLPGFAQFRLESTQFAGLDADFSAVPAVADLDNDGDLDLLVGEFGITGQPRVFHLRNDGTTEAPVWTTVSDNRTIGSVFVPGDLGRQLAPELADVDRDGDLDLLLGEEPGNVNFYRNVGDASVFEFQSVTERLADADVGDNSAPLWVDVDDDRDLDLVVGERNGGLSFFRDARNVGLGDLPPDDPQPQVLPDRTRLWGAFPNPANPRTVVRFELRASGPVLLRVVDPRGRRVRTLLDGVLQARPGPIDVVWDGKDDAGQDVSSGVFLVILQADDRVHRGKVTLVR